MKIFLKYFSENLIFILKILKTYTSYFKSFLRWLRELNTLQIKKTTSSIWQHTRCKYSQHNQTKKRAANIILYLFVFVSICFFYLHVFSEVAARWALSATVHFAPLAYVSWFKNV